MINLLQNLGLQPQPAAAPPGPVERYPPRPPPPPLPAGRSVAQTSSNPWVAPDFPREPDVCRECELREPHICPYSERGSESAGSLRRADVAGPPADPRLPPGISHQHCQVNQWVVQNSQSGAPRHGQLSPGAAAAGPSQNYAGSIMLSVASRHEISIHSAFRKLQRAVVKRKLTNGKGEKQIAHAQKSMSDCASKLDLKEDIEAHLLTVIEAALDKSEDLAEHAMQRLDDLARDEKEARGNVLARPRLSYETFSGDISQFPTFQANQRELYKIFQDKNAADGGAAQQLFQLSKISSPEL